MCFAIIISLQKGINILDCMNSPFLPPFEREGPEKRLDNMIFHVFVNTRMI
jgi:hypothetical protein